MLYLMTKFFSFYATRQAYIQGENIFRPDLYLNLLNFIGSILYCVVFMCLDFVVTSIVVMFASIFLMFGFALLLTQTADQLILDHHLQIDVEAMRTNWFAAGTIAALFMTLFFNTFVFVIYRREVSLFVSGRVMEKEHTQFKSILNMIPDSVIITRDIRPADASILDNESIRALDSKPVIEFCNKAASILALEPNLNDRSPEELIDHPFLEERILKYRLNEDNDRHENVADSHNQHDDDSKRFGVKSLADVIKENRLQNVVSDEDKSVKDSVNNEGLTDLRKAEVVQAVKENQIYYIGRETAVAGGS